MSVSPWLDGIDPLLSQYKFRVCDFENHNEIVQQQNHFGIVSSRSVSFQFAGKTENRNIFVHRLTTYHFILNGVERK